PEVSPGIALTCRAVQISQILVNLLNNALDAVRNARGETATSGWVEIRVDTIGERVLIRVLDSGPGVPEELESKIMQPFFTTKGAGRGTGLGLSISAAIAKEHGGSLRLDKKVSASCFVLELKISA